MNDKKEYLTVILLLCLITSCKVPDALKIGYYKENDKIVRYSGFPAQGFIVEHADVNTFKSINNDYGIDKDNVYFGSKIIINADPLTFVYLGGPFSKDKNNGYYQDQILSNGGADFRVLPNSDNPPAIEYARDSKFVYKSNSIVKNVDAETFTFVPMFNGNYLTYDKNKVYFNDMPVADANGTSFQKISGFYFKDNANVWALILGRDITWVKVLKADAGSFEAVKEYYAKDKNNVFYEDKIVVGADIPTFEETKNGEAKDKNGVYSDGVLVKK